MDKTVSGGPREGQGGKAMVGKAKALRGAALGRAPPDLAEAPNLHAPPKHCSGWGAPLRNIDATTGDGAAGVRSGLA